jgi:hypothetical protein
MLTGAIFERRQWEVRNEMDWKTDILSMALAFLHSVVLQLRYRHSKRKNPKHRTVRTLTSHQNQ